MLNVLMYLSLTLLALFLIPFCNLSPVWNGIGMVIGLLMSWIGYSEFKKEPTNERFVCLALVIAVFVLAIYLGYRWVVYIITIYP